MVKGEVEIGALRGREFPVTVPSGSILSLRKTVPSNSLIGIFNTECGIIAALRAAAAQRTLFQLMTNDQ